MTTAKPTTHPLLTDSFFERLKEHLVATTGMSYYLDRSNELADHVRRHLSRLAIPDCWSYLQLLKCGPAGDRELDNLIEDLTIGETFFFRHTALFTALERTILPAAIERNQERRRLRIWSAGSSIGAEAYTISILLRRHLSHLIPDWDVTIVGTDINRAFLSRAADAEFEDWALRGVSATIRERCFSRRGSSWKLHPEFQRGVTFQHHNLAKDPFPSIPHNLYAFDVILCRNVMIYFSPPVVENVIVNMRRCLVDGGWLLVGHAEHNQERFRDFHSVHFDGATVYQRVGKEAAATHAASWDPALRSVTRTLERDTHATAAPSETERGLRSGLWSDQASHPQPAEAGLAGGRATRKQQRGDGGFASEFEKIRDLADRGELEVAEARCQQLLKAHKLNPTCHLYHALILEQLGRHAMCEQALRRAIYLDRNCVLAHYYLGLTLQRMGRQATEAARPLRNARQLLAALEPDRVINDSDGLTVAELRKLTEMQLQTIDS